MEYSLSYLYRRDGDDRKGDQMKKLTKIGIAFVFGLTICLLLSTSGAFAQSVNQGNPATATWGRHHRQVNLWRNPRGHNGCGGSFCNQGFGEVRCARVVKLVKVWYTRRVVETFRTLRISKMLVNVYTDWGIKRVVREVKTWQVHRVVKTVRALRVERQALRVCHAL
jgi:hypothetical protein